MTHKKINAFKEAFKNAFMYNSILSTSLGTPNKSLSIFQIITRDDNKTIKVINENTAHGQN